MTLMLGVLAWGLIDHGALDFTWWAAMAVTVGLLFSLPGLVRALRKDR